MIDFQHFCDTFRDIMAQNGFSAYTGEAHAKAFHQLTERMLETNEKMNLTAIKEIPAIILLHYADSLTAAQFLPQSARVADVGCGAGFPCLPLALCRPDLSILALDSTEKRIRYVAETASALHCNNLSAVAMRAEVGGQGEHRERFDVCTARAVAALPPLCELCLPFVSVGGTFLAMKAKKGEDELKEAKNGIKRLGGECAAVHHVKLVHGEQEEERTLIEIKKVAHTPAEFPRPWAKILKRPL